MAGKRNKALDTGTGARKFLRGQRIVSRQFCQDRAEAAQLFQVIEAAKRCDQTPWDADIAARASKWLDCRATMLQAISIGRDIPMLEPWIIDEIRRREEERRRGDRSQLELPIPEQNWPTEDDVGNASNRQGEDAPERGVLIIGM